MQFNTKNEYVTLNKIPNLYPGERTSLEAKTQGSFQKLE